MCTAGIAIGLIALGLGMFALAGALYAIRELTNGDHRAYLAYRDSVTKSDDRASGIVANVTKNNPGHCD